MDQLGFTYADVIALSIKASWEIDDVLPADAVIRFDRPHLPDTLVHAESLSFLDAEQKQTLNHLRGLSYMNLLAFVEEYIIAQTVNHVHAEMHGDHDAMRALLRFGEEEVKHQMLFKRYCRSFQRDFAHECQLLSSATEVASEVLSNSALAVMFTTLHLEMMTLHHFTAAVREDAALDPLVVNILKHHWMEESQHAKIDLLELEKMHRVATPESIEAALAEYLGILSGFDLLLARQCEMDADNLELATGVSIGDDRESLQSLQHRSYRECFLVMGMTNPRFVETLAAFSPTAEAQLAAAALTYS